MVALAGRTALVTGASRGIGRAVALRLARDGAFVVVHYGTRQDAADEVLAAIVAEGGAGCIAAADLAQPDAPSDLFAAVDRLLAEQGRERLDILVNNAGIGLMRDVTNITLEEFERVFAINVRAPLFLAQEAARRMGTGGRIINISSVVGERAFGGNFVGYGATKAALDYMTRSMAVTLGGRGITVNAVAPGATATDFLGPSLENPQVLAHIRADSALGDIGQADDMANVVAFLASEDARWITGERIRASGGTQL